MVSLSRRQCQTLFISQSRCTTNTPGILSPVLVCNGTVGGTVGGGKQQQQQEQKRSEGQSVKTHRFFLLRFTGNASPLGLPALLHPDATHVKSRRVWPRRTIGKILVIAAAG